MKVSLVIFSLNEIDGMKAIMPQIKKEWYDELIIVDVVLQMELLNMLKRTAILYLFKRKRYRRCICRSYGKVTGDIVVIFSPDGNSIPEAIPKLVDKMKEGYDMVIASRYLKGAKSYDDDRITSFGNWMFTTLINVLFGAHYTDSLVMYRAFKKIWLKT